MINTFHLPEAFSQNLNIQTSNNQSLVSKQTGIGNLEVFVSGKLALCSHHDRGSIDLDVQGGVPPYTFRWNNNDTNPSRVNLNAGTYTVYITDSNGTQITEQIIIQPPFPLVLGAIQTKNATCASSRNGSAKINVALGREGGYRVVWSHGLVDKFEAKDLPPGDYTVTVFDIFNCSTAVSFSIETDNVGIRIDEAVYGSNCGLEYTASIDLDVSGGQAPYSFQWSHGPTTKDLKKLSAGIYTVQVTDAAGCTVSKDIKIDAIASEPLLAKIDSSIEVDCENGAYYGILWIDIEGGRPPYSFNWNNGESNSREFKFYASSEILVEVTDANGCVVFDQIRTDFPEEYESRKIGFEFLKSSIEYGDEIFVNDSIAFSSFIAHDYLSWEWDFGDGYQSKDLNPVHSYGKAGSYDVRLTAYDIYGCSVTETNTVQVSSHLSIAVMPNAFSPNGDGLNDILKPVMKRIKHFQMDIFNQWGEHIFSESGLEINGWDGMHKGRFLPSGNYIYKISYHSIEGDMVHQTGAVTLIR